MYGQDGRKVFARLQELRNDPTTPKRLKAQIDFFVIERMFGRAPQLLGVETGTSFWGGSTSTPVRQVINAMALRLMVVTSPEPNFTVSESGDSTSSSPRS